MDYSNIKDFLGKFKTLLSQKEESENLIISIIKEETNINLLPKKIKIKGDILYIDVTPILKNEIFIKKNNILEKISGKLTPKIVDIK